MKVVVKKPNENPFIKEIDGSLESMQSVVGGYIETLPLDRDAKYIIVLNEEGKLIGLDPNFQYGRSDVIVGTVFICKNGNGNLEGLTDEEAERIMAVFS